MANQENGAIEYGSGVFSGIATAGGIVLVPPQAPGVDIRTSLAYPTISMMTAAGRGSLALVVNIAADHAFTLDYQFTPDGGSTWYIGQQVASATVTVDGGVAGNTQNARLDIQVGYQYRVQMWNASGSDIAGAYEWRLYSDNT